MEGGEAGGVAGGTASSGKVQGGANGDDDIICVVCKSGKESAGTGPIILCDSMLVDANGKERECSGAAHLRCSNLAEVPGKGVDWLCWSCCEVPTPSRQPMGAVKDAGKGSGMAQ